VRGVRRTIPRAVWPLVVALARVVDRVRPLEIATPQGLAMIGSRLLFDARKAREELGWRPRPFEQVLRETIAVLRERGLLPAAS
jgi:nucleoside-diphosphate-sugar epimerase